MEINETQLDELIKFKDNIRQTGIISKGSVLSLESFIGTNVITSKININKYTNAPTAICGGDTVELLEEYISSVSIQQDVTFSNLAETINKCKYLVKEYYSNLVSLKNSDQSTIDNITNERFIYFYNNENILDTILNQQLFDVLLYRKDYVNSILAANDINTVDKYNSIMTYVSGINTINKTNDDIYIFTALHNIINNSLIDVIYDRHINIGSITVADMVKAVYDIDTITNKLHEVYLHIDEHLTDIIKYNHIYNINKRELYTMYKRYNNLYNVLEDQQSMLLIKIILTIFNK